MNDPTIHKLDARLDALLLEIIQRFHQEGPEVFEDQWSEALDEPHEAENHDGPAVLSTSRSVR
jgi:hypothetical protein